MHNKCVGRGYDGSASTMTGNDVGVQKLFREPYKKVFYFHCTGHKFNLVHDSNGFLEMGTIKDTTHDFRKSIMRRNHAS